MGCTWAAHGLHMGCAHAACAPHACARGCTVAGERRTRGDTAVGQACALGAGEGLVDHARGQRGRRRRLRAGRAAARRASRGASMSRACNPAGTRAATACSRRGSRMRLSPSAATVRGRSTSRATTGSASTRPTRVRGGATASATRTTRTPRPPRARGRRGRRGRRAVRSASASSRARSCSAPPGRRAPHGRYTCGAVRAEPVHTCGAPLQMIRRYVGAPTSGVLPYGTVSCVIDRVRVSHSASAHVHVQHV